MPVIVASSRGFYKSLHNFRDGITHDMRNEMAANRP
jgi:hypothetical protein